jgi:hypothetical protein
MWLDSRSLGPSPGAGVPPLVDVARRPTPLVAHVPYYVTPPQRPASSTQRPFTRSHNISHGSPQPPILAEYTTYCETGSREQQRAAASIRSALSLHRFCFGPAEPPTRSPSCRRRQSGRIRNADSPQRPDDGSSDPARRWWPPTRLALCRGRRAIWPETETDATRIIVVLD